MQVRAAWCCAGSSPERVHAGAGYCFLCWSRLSGLVRTSRRRVGWLTCCCSCKATSEAGMRAAQICASCRSYGTFSTEKATHWSCPVVYLRSLEQADAHITDAYITDAVTYSRGPRALQSSTQRPAQERCECQFHVCTQRPAGRRQRSVHLPNQPQAHAWLTHA